MKERIENNYAFIDSQNLYFGLKRLGWKMDYRRFRVYLQEKYDVGVAYMFIGYIDDNSNLYRSLQEAGFILVFKPTVLGTEGKIKGNCDAELVLHAMIEYHKYHQAVIVTGDGDFHCLIQYFIQERKLFAIIAPSPADCSSLIKRIGRNWLGFLSNIQSKVERQKEKNPVRTEP